MVQTSVAHCPLPSSPALRFPQHTHTLNAMTISKVLVSSENNNRYVGMLDARCAISIPSSRTIVLDAHSHGRYVWPRFQSDAVIARAWSDVCNSRTATKCGGAVRGNIAGWMVYMAQVWEMEYGNWSGDNTPIKVETLLRKRNSFLVPVVQFLINQPAAKAMTVYALVASHQTIWSSATPSPIRPTVMIARSRERSVE